MDVRTEIDSRDADSLLRQLQSRVDNPQPAFEEIGRSLVTMIQMGFRMSRSPWGVPWLPIKFRAPKVRQVATKEGRKQVRDAAGNLVFTKAGAAQAAANEAAAAGKGSAGRPLVDTGKLRASITSRADKTGVEIGTNAQQAKLQHFGGVVKPKRGTTLAFPGPGGEMIFARSVKIPARPFMPVDPSNTVQLPPAWKRNVLRIIEKHLRVTA